MGDLEPRSPEWFAALLTFAPLQAAHTRQIIKLAGRSDVCSICGDAPATDYLLNSETLPPLAVRTLRLCDDCHEIRGMQGEHFSRTQGEIRRGYFAPRIHYRRVVAYPLCSQEWRG